MKMVALERGHHLADELRLAVLAHFFTPRERENAQGEYSRKADERGVEREDLPFAK
jgi:hypothetical protein